MATKRERLTVASSKTFLEMLDATDRAFVHVDVHVLRAAIYEAQAQAVDNLATPAATPSKFWEKRLANWAQYWRNRIDLEDQRMQLKARKR